jgi:hypothetical protein
MHPTRLVRLLALTAALAAPPVAVSGEGTRSHETPIVVRLDGRGFAWTDAAVGAVAGIGATLVTAGCIALVRLRPSEPPALGSREES